MFLDPAPRDPGHGLRAMNRGRHGTQHVPPLNLRQTVRIVPSVPERERPQCRWV